MFWELNTKQKSTDTIKRKSLASSLGISTPGTGSPHARLWGLHAKLHLVYALQYAECCLEKGLYLVLDVKY